ncbi:hypothetical protein B0H10DRAFT_1955989 [Mycena sp. CBHHK59/15]|nr:hypothetical protein B0H10DRAFT_1955989 [Mycena sp. CBHHK59/15]
MPILRDIPMDDEGEDDDELPALQTVPVDELSEDEDDSDDEDETPKKGKPYSSPLSSAPPSPSNVFETPSAKQLFPYFASSLSPAPASSSPMCTPRTERKLMNERIQIQRQGTLAKKKAAEHTAKAKEQAERDLQKQREEEDKKGGSLKPDTATRRLTFIKSDTFQKVRHMGLIVFQLRHIAKHVLALSRPNTKLGFLLALD